MTATVKRLFNKIMALRDEDREALELALARKSGKEWIRESGNARRIAKKRKIGMKEIDGTIARHRYGK